VAQHERRVLGVRRGLQLALHMVDRLLRGLPQRDGFATWKPTAKDDAGGFLQRLQVHAEEEPDEFEHGGLPGSGTTSQHDAATFVFFLAVAGLHSVAILLGVRFSRRISVLLLEMDRARKKFERTSHRTKREPSRVWCASPHTQCAESELPRATRAVQTPWRDLKARSTERETAVLAPRSPSTARKRESRPPSRKSTAADCHHALPGGRYANAAAAADVCRIRSFWSTTS